MKKVYILLAMVLFPLLCANAQVQRDTVGGWTLSKEVEKYSSIPLSYFSLRQGDTAYEGQKGLIVKLKFQYSGSGKKFGIEKKFDRDITLYSENTPVNRQFIGNAYNVLATDNWYGCMEGFAVYKDDSELAYFGPNVMFGWSGNMYPGWHLTCGILQMEDNSLKFPLSFNKILIWFEPIGQEMTLALDGLFVADKINNGSGEDSQGYNIYIPLSPMYYLDRFGDTPKILETEKTEIPKSFELNQNYPNPFNPRTTIQFSIEKRGRVVLEIFDILGRKVETLVDETLLPGTYQKNFVPKNLPSGTYFYRLTENNFSQSQKMIYAK
jgi:hypothetical protein